MKANLILFIILILLGKTNFSCEVCTSDFCQYINNNNNELFLKGKIVAVDSLHASIQVIEILHGNEARDTIYVWANSDTIFAEGSACEELFSRTTKHLGRVNDHLIIGLNKIQEVKNDWDIESDYRIPTKIYNTPWLKVENDTVYGRIYVDDSCEPTRKIYKKSYNEFKAHWSTGSFNCDNLVSVEKTINSDVQIRIANNFIVVNHEGSHEFETEIYNINGKLIFAEKSRCDCTVDLNAIEKGILIVIVSEEGRTFFTQKVFNH